VIERLAENLSFVAGQLRPWDVLDMFLVWVVVYRVLILVRHTGTVQMLSGLGILAIAYLSSIWLELFTFNWILEKFLSVTSQFADTIIVADQQSTDASRKICRRFPKVILIDNPNRDYNELSRQQLLIAAARESYPGPRILQAIASTFQLKSWRK
jgi:DNA integrity scanning protein DisA with diadenylate cyclase activity